MKNKLQKEWFSIFLVLIPFIYLAYIWNSLPEKVPIHWNLKGEVDGWGDKFSLIGLLFMLPVLTYGIMLLVPKIDPKNKIDTMGNKYKSLRLILVFFTSVLALFILFSAKNQSMSSPVIIVSLIGFLFMALGNYFKVIKQNYFVGIRTPWTLESEEVWKLTHQMAGKIWVIGGAVITIFCFFLPEDFIVYLILTVTIIITVVPVGYSYFKFKELKKD